jgi:hypothetical protein
VGSRRSRRQVAALHAVHECVDRHSPNLRSVPLKGRCDASCTRPPEGATQGIATRGPPEDPVVGGREILTGGPLGLPAPRQGWSESSGDAAEPAPGSWSASSAFWPARSAPSSRERRARGPGLPTSSPRCRSKVLRHEEFMGSHRPPPRTPALPSSPAGQTCPPRRSARTPGGRQRAARRTEEGYQSVVDRRCRCANRSAVRPRPRLHTRRRPAGSLAAIRHPRNNGWRRRLWSPPAGTVRRHAR